jgi:hypothetical protein
LRSHILSPTVIFKDNKPCVEQLTAGYIKGDKTKHIEPMFFFKHKQQGKAIDVQCIPSEKKIADLLTKALPPVTHSELKYSIWMHSLSKISQEIKKKPLLTSGRDQTTTLKIFSLRIENFQYIYKAATTI